MKYKFYNKTKATIFHSIIGRALTTIALVLVCLPVMVTAQVLNTESFDGSFPSSGWSTSGSTNYLFVTNSGINPVQSPHSGSGELQWQSYNAPNGATAGLISPTIDWAYRGGNTPTVSFWLYRDVTGYNSAAYDLEGVNVYANSPGNGATLLGFVPRRGGASATGAYLVSGVATTTTSGWYQYTFNIPSSYNGSDNTIAFDFYSQYGNNTFIDDIQYVSYPNPVSLTVNPQTTCTGNPVSITNACTSPNAAYYVLYFYFVFYQCLPVFLSALFIIKTY